MTQRSEFAALEESARRFWALLLESGWRAADAHLKVRFPELDVFKGDDQAQLFFVAAARAAHPLAELLASLAPPTFAAEVGRPPASHQRVLREVLEQTGVNLETSRVRAGFTRGHLLEVVVHVPFDVEGDVDALQVAAEVYLESRLGDRFMDLWVADVSIDRIARTRGLLMLSDARDQAEHYPIEQASELLDRAARGVSSELPLSKLLHALDEAWTALEIPTLACERLGDRTFASTREPEALKAALEGMPFASSRFTRGGELFVWCAWTADLDLQVRLRVREEVESALAGLQGVSLAGTGFGARRDFLDLWLVPDLETVERVGRTICARTGAVQLGFYDSSYSEELLEFRRSP